MNHRALVANLLVLMMAAPAPARQAAAGASEKPAPTTASEKPARATADPGRQTGSAASRKNQREQAIRGRVVADGQPVAEASILVTPVGASMTRPETILTRLHTAGTDDKGDFAVEGVAPGVYSLAVNLPGYVAVSTTTPEGDQSAYYRPGDYVTIRLTKGGVITGRVTDSAGIPVVAVRIHVTRLRDEEGRPVRDAGIGTIQDLVALSREWKTDDRGVYRVFGLPPGAYVVSAGGAGVFSFDPDAFSGEAPTYFPSSTRDTAMEVVVRAGAEVTGIDISYRDFKGHVVSGSVTGAMPPGGLMSGLIVLLTSASTGALQGMAVGLGRGEGRSFGISGVADGEFYVMAMAGGGSDEMTVSSPRRLSVKGSDVTGIELTLAAPGRVDGRALLEALPDTARTAGGCQPRRVSPIEETVMLVESEEKDKSAGGMFSGKSLAMFLPGSSSTPDSKGDFSLRLFSAGRYRIEPQLPGDEIYVRSITLPAAAEGKPRVDASTGLSIKSGDHVTGLAVTLAEGAAGLAGRVVPASAGTSLPPRLRVILAPAEPEAADNVLRFARADVRGDATFAIRYLAPGRYFVLAQQAPEEEDTSASSPPSWFDAKARNRLLRHARSANVVVELQPCKRIGDYAVRWGAPAAEDKTAAPKSP